MEFDDAGTVVEGFKDTPFGFSIFFISKNPQSVKNEGSLGKFVLMYSLLYLCK